MPEGWQGCATPYINGTIKPVPFSQQDVDAQTSQAAHLTGAEDHLDLIPNHSVWVPIRQCNPADT